MSVCGSRLESTEVIAYGGAMFFVTNDHTGDTINDRSVITNNPGCSWYPTSTRIAGHSDTPIAVSTSIIR